jgi:hypothetical protein
MALIKLNLQPSRADLRAFGFIALGVFGVLGALIYLHWIPIGRLLGSATSPVAFVLWGLGGLSGLLSLVAPQGNRALYIGMSVVGYPIGLVFSYAILGTLFYLILTPLGLVFRIMGRDALHLRFDRGVPTYWVKREPREMRSYFRQH